MDTADLDGLVDELSSNIDDLEESLAPLLKSGLSQSTSKLPLLDKAKAYVFTTYAIESILISYLRLNGVDGKSHPVFQEMARVKEYNGKIKAAENGSMKRSTALDREAANRMIKHGLAGNDKYDQERAQRVAAEKAGAKRKLEEMSVGTHTRFDGAAKRIKASEHGQDVVEVVKAAEVGSDGEEDNGATSSSTSKKAKQKNRRKERKLEGTFSQSHPIEREAGAGIESTDQTDSAEAAPRTGNESMSSAKADASAGGNDTASGKKRKSRRKKTAEKMANPRAEEMM